MLLIAGCGKAAALRLRVMRGSGFSESPTLKARQKPVLSLSKRPTARVLEEANKKDPDRANDRLEFTALVRIADRIIRDDRPSLR